MTDPTNPYAPPKASLDLPDAMRQSQGLDDALAGRWDFEIGSLMSEAWARVPGFKGTFWATAIVGVIVVGVTQVGVAIVQGILGALLSPWIVMILTAAMSALMMSIFYPVLYLPIFSAGLDRVDGRPGVMRTVFDFKESILAAAIAGLLIGLFSTLGLFMLIVPGLYVIAVYSMTVGILREHKVSPWEAMELSRKACGHHWLKLIGLLVVVGLITSLGGVLTLGIGLIWFLPWNALIYAVLYRRIFGRASSA